MSARLCSFDKMLAAMVVLTQCAAASGQETLPAVTKDSVPRTVEELWARFDPRAEPLDTETLKQWEEDDVVLRIVRYRIGLFKGQKAMMAAVYGYPKEGRDLPGLVQIHGGGQYADHRAVLTNARRGYATISIAWAGRISAPGYAVTPDIVSLFWAGKTGDPRYKLTTDWGALDAYHAPCRNSKNAFSEIAPRPWTIDDVESPRNNSWFLCTLGARRALTFLEQQQEVDRGKLGVYGHSMGGKITVMTAATDSRVKAAAPSCGGLSDRHSSNRLFRATIGDDAYLKRISCPIIFLSPANDFHGSINDLQKAVSEIASEQWRLTCSPHHNHQDTPQYETAGPLWFDQHLKGTFTYPKTPESSLELKTGNGVPLFSVKPDASQPILYVDVYYTQQGREVDEITNIVHRMNRFWHHAQAKQDGKAWTADLPVLDTDKPLWVYANVVYPLDEPLTGAGYYYGIYTATRFNLSSTMHIVAPAQLAAAGVRATLMPSLVIESFADGWEKQWFTYRPEDWARKTHKVYDQQWKAPPSAKLALEVKAEKTNRLVAGIDEYAADVQLTGNNQWQPIVLSPGDFRNATGDRLPDWNGIKEFRLSGRATLVATVDGENKVVQLGGDWQGAKPAFRNLQWIEE